MKVWKERLTGLTNAIGRYPLTTLFLLAASTINAYDISAGKSNPKLLLTFVVGAFLSAVAQAVYERFLSRRFILMGIAALLTVGYYLIIMPSPTLSMETGIRTGVALFALLLAFILVPAIRFNQSFMLAFKSLFKSLFFSGVLFGGISIILAAMNQLILTIDSTAYAHAANLIFVIFAPMYFLSLIPGDADCPGFLRILLSYIIVPLLAVFTLILVIYIVKNISGKFWTDNLLEPMLISYAITVILVYILASEIENKLTILFRKIFPKVLVPIVLFQIASSFLSISETGVTYGRYYVILFGIFAAIAGILMSFLPVRKNGIIAALLILFAFVSIVPPTDAFTISRNSQINTLKNVLVRNHMLENNQIKPNGSISDKDKRTITSTVSYLTMMGYSMAWLPKNFDFAKTFGFQEYQGTAEPEQAVYLSLAQSDPLPIAGYDTFVQTDIANGSSGKVCELKKDGKTYSLSKDKHMNFSLTEEDGRELLGFNTQEIFDKFSHYNSAKGQISADEASFKKENGRAKMAIVVVNICVDKSNVQNNNAQVYVLLKIK